MLTIYGGDVEFLPGRIEWEPNALHVALGARPSSLRVDDTATVSVQSPSSILCGRVEVVCGSDRLVLLVPPNSTSLCDQLVKSVDYSKKSADTAESDRAGVIVAAAECDNPDPASLRRASTCRVVVDRSGSVTSDDERVWELSKDPEERISRVVELGLYLAGRPLLAYNAQLLAIGLTSLYPTPDGGTAPIADAFEAPLGCLLTLQRHSDTTVDGLPDGSSPELALSLDDTLRLLRAIVNNTATGEIESTGGESLSPNDSTDAAWVSRLFSAWGLWLGQIHAGGSTHPCLDCESSILDTIAREKPKKAKPTKPEAKKPRNAKGSRPFWAKSSTPNVVPDPNPNADPDNPLFEKLVVLTGDFEPHGKGELWNAMANRGATVQKNVTLKTTLLVVGSWSSMTSKEKKAREYIDRGKPIEIWPAQKLYDTLGIVETPDDEEPPF